MAVEINHIHGTSDPISIGFGAAAANLDDIYPFTLNAWINTTSDGAGWFFWGSYIYDKVGRWIAFSNPGGGSMGEDENFGAIEYWVQTGDPFAGGDPLWKKTAGGFWPHNVGYHLLTITHDGGLHPDGIHIWRDLVEATYGGERASGGFYHTDATANTAIMEFGRGDIDQLYIHQAVLGFAEMEAIFYAGISRVGMQIQPDKLRLYPELLERSYGVTPANPIADLNKGISGSKTQGHRYIGSQWSTPLTSQI